MPKRQHTPNPTAAQHPPKALLVTTTSTVVAPSYTSAVLMLRSPMLAVLVMAPDRWPSGSVVQTADELHLTLCYLGDVADLDPRRAAVAAAVQALAAQLPLISGEISGIGRFSSADGMDAVHLSFDSPDLNQWVVRLQEGLEAAGFPCSRKHGHDPHITLAFVPAGELVDLPPPWPMEIWFENVTLGWGTEYTDYALGGAPFDPMPSNEDLAEAAQAATAAAGETEADGQALGTANQIEGWAGAQGVDTPTAAGHPLAESDTTSPFDEGDALKGAPWLAKGWQRNPERKNDPTSRDWKTLPHHVKDIDGRTVVGIFSVFGNVDSYLDICMPGSFAKTFRERRGQIHHLWQHDTQQPPIAVIDQLQEVGRDALPAVVQAAYPEAVGGAEVRRTYLEGPELANWVLEAIAKGAPMQMSYMYDPLRFEYLEQDGQRLRLIYEQRCWETSDVLWGANSATRASKALATLPPLPLDTLLGQLETQLIRAQKAGARHSDADTRMLNTIHQLAVQLGCTRCKGTIEDEEAADPKAAPGRSETSTHAPTGPSLADLSTKLHYLTFLNGDLA